MRPESLPRILELFPGAELVRIADAGHWVVVGDMGVDVVYLSFRSTPAMNIGCGGGEVTEAMTQNAWHSVQGCSLNPTSLIQVDGTSNTGNQGTTGYTHAIGLSVDQAGSTWSGWIAQCGIWPLDNTSVLTAMNANQHTNWGF